MIEIVMHSVQVSIAELPDQPDFRILKFTDPTSGISVTIPMTGEQATAVANGLKPSSGLVVPKQNLIFPVK